MHSNKPVLGFNVLVAPTYKNASAWNPSRHNPPLPGDVFGLFWRANGSSQMAPSLHTFARKILEAKQMQPEEIDLFLKSLGGLARYDRAFRKFYIFCKFKNIDLECASIYESAGLLISFNEHNKNEARNTYSALVLLPGWDQLRFSPLIRKSKQAWNSTNQKIWCILGCGALIGRVGHGTFGF